MSRFLEPIGPWIRVRADRVRQGLADWQSQRREGQGLIEYGLVMALISMSAIAMIYLFGPSLRNMYSHVVSSIKL